MTGLYSCLSSWSLQDIPNIRSQAEVKDCELMAVYEYNLTLAGESVRLSPAENPNEF
jgi:hypothetical protein